MIWTNENPQSSMQRIFMEDVPTVGQIFDARMRKTWVATWGPEGPREIFTNLSTQRKTMGKPLENHREMEVYHPNTVNVYSFIVVSWEFMVVLFIWFHAI